MKQPSVTPWYKSQWDKTILQGSIVHAQSGKTKMRGDIAHSQSPETIWYATFGYTHNYQPEISHTLVLPHYPLSKFDNGAEKG
ncbi:MAG: hypothetical protein LBV12_01330 [Puniceicoccales bacterium]|jgi:hypothetical protein|nr:hypothetical protein [Puniceicoccales bacterium]